MSNTASVCEWIALLKEGDPVAVRQIWDHFSRALVQLARARLAGVPRRAADEEDVALSAFDSFCRAAESGQFAQLLDRNDLWQLLVLFTVRQANHLRRYERQQKRGSGKVCHESALPPDAATGQPATLDTVLGREPTPAFAAETADACRHLLERLGDPQLEAIALGKLEGYTHDELAQELGCSRRTIDRKLGLIRGIWEQEGGA